MKLTFDRERWLSLIEQPCSAIANRSTLPILSFLSISIVYGRLTVTGTDLITTATRFTETDQPDEAVCVEAKKLLDVIRAMPKGAEIALETKESAATLKSGRSRFKLETADALDYPNRSYEKPKAVLWLAASDLAAQIEFVRRAMASKDVRYYLNGIHLQHANGLFSAQATNGHRMSIVTRPLKSSDAVGAESAPEFSVIVDRNSVQNLVKFIAGQNGEIELAVHSTKIELHGESGSVSCQLIHGKYPDVQRTTPPPTAKTIVSVERAKLIDVAGRVAMASDPRDNGILLSVLQDKIKLVAFKCGSEVGEDEIDALVAVGIADEGGSMIEIGLNPTYLIDALESFSEDEVILRFTDAMGALRIDVGAESDPFVDGACCVIMPCRI